MKVGFVYNLQIEKTLAEAEFDTAETIDAIDAAIAEDGHEVVRIEMTADDKWIARLNNSNCDVVFNTAEGFRGVGRESLGPIIFEQLNIPYIGPGPYVSFLTLDKYLTKQVVAARQVPVPEGHFIKNLEELFAVAGELHFPVIVKPNYEGSSKGITAESVCHDEIALSNVMSICVHALGIVDLGRADFRVDEKGEVCFIEFNALPSLQPSAGIFAATRLLNLDYAGTIRAILNAGVQRMELKGRSSRTPRRTFEMHPTIAVVYNLRRKHQGQPGFEDEAEFDSPQTIEALTSAIRDLKYCVVPIEATKDLAEELKAHDVDVVFNIAEGIADRGREAQVPAICDLLGIEHTGSDATCMSITLDKALTKKIVAAEGIQCPRSMLYTLNNPQLNLVCPVEFEPETTAAIHRFARKVFAVLGCRDVARIDFRMDANNAIQFFEINPLPGLTPGFSDLVIMAERSGVPFGQLIKQILMPAIRRWRMHKQPGRPNQLPVDEGSAIVG